MYMLQLVCWTWNCVIQLASVWFGSTKFQWTVGWNIVRSSEIVRILFAECHIEYKFLSIRLQNSDTWHIPTHSLEPPHFSHNGTDSEDLTIQDGQWTILFVGHAEQFHIFHSMQDNSITMQKATLEVQQYFKNY